MTTYHSISETASSTGPIVADDHHRRQALERAREEVRGAPSRLALWSLRIAQHVRLGALGYQQSWTALRDAAVAGGATEAAALRTLFHSFASAQIVRDEPPPLADLATRGLS